MLDSGTANEADNTLYSSKNKASILVRRSCIPQTDVSAGDPCPKPLKIVKLENNRQKKKKIRNIRGVS